MPRRSQNFKMLITGLIVLAIFAMTVPLGTRVAGGYLAELGFKNLMAGNYSSAVQNLKSAKSLVTQSPDFHILYGRSLMKLAEESRSKEILIDFLKEALESFKTAAELNPREARAWSDMARCYYWMANVLRDHAIVRQGKTAIEKALALDPNNGFFLYNLVNIQLFLGDWGGASKNISKLARVYPLAYFDISFPGWKGYAGQAFSKSLHESVENSLIRKDGLSVLAFIAAENKNWPQAAEYMRKLIKRSEVKETSSLYLRLGYYLLAGGRQDEAKEAFLQGIKLSVWQSRADVLKKLLVFLHQSKALKLFVHLVHEAATFDTEVYGLMPLLLGKAYYLQGDMKRAQNEFTRAINKGDDPEARYFLSKIAAQNGDWEEAEVQSFQGIVLDRVRHKLYYCWAEALLAQEKYRPALEAIEKAIHYAGRPRPGERDHRPGYLDFQARIFETMGNFPKAIDIWKEAARIAEYDARFPNAIANLYAKEGDLFKAEQYYLKALALTPNDQRIKNQLQIIKTIRGKKESAS